MEFTSKNEGWPLHTFLWNCGGNSQSAFQKNPQKLCTRSSFLGNYHKDTGDPSSPSQREASCPLPSSLCPEYLRESWGASQRLWESCRFAGFLRLLQLLSYAIKACHIHGKWGPRLLLWVHAFIPLELGELLINSLLHFLHLFNASSLCSFYWGGQFLQPPMSFVTMPSSCLWIIRTSLPLSPCLAQRTFT